MGFMPNFADEHSFHPRFSLWYAESLIQGYELTGDKKYLVAAANTARAFAKAQQKEGTIFYENYTNGKEPDKGSATGSAVAFAGIVWLKLAAYGYKEFDANIEKSAEWILKNRYAQNHPDPNLRGAPSGHVVPIREIRLSAGAGFVVVICGEIMTMPGLPRVPSAEHIRLDVNGDIEGLS